MKNVWHEQEWIWVQASTLILNANHPLVQYVVEHKDSENTSIICKQLYDLAMLAHKPLSPEEMTAFVQRK